jgi:hypothetical protein
MFITLTVAPGDTEAGTMYLKPLMWIIASARGLADAAEDGDAAEDDATVAVDRLRAEAEPPPDGAPEDPHAESTTMVRTPAPRPEPDRARTARRSLARWLADLLRCTDWPSLLRLVGQ